MRDLNEKFSTYLRFIRGSLLEFKRGSCVATRDWTVRHGCPRISVTEGFTLSSDRLAQTEIGSAAGRIRSLEINPRTLAYSAGQRSDCDPGQIDIREAIIKRECTVSVIVFASKKALSNRLPKTAKIKRFIDKIISVHLIDVNKSRLLKALIHRFDCSPAVI
jgi:hypothetical protein